MKRIGVICAFNPHNYGMFSVDLAARHFFCNPGPDTAIVRGMDNVWLLPFAPEPPPAKPRHFVHFFGRTLGRASQAFVQGARRVPPKEGPHRSALRWISTPPAAQHNLHQPDTSSGRSLKPQPYGETPCYASSSPR